jgi:hypothetical protein
VTTSAQKENHSERQTEQKTDMRRAKRAERPCQPALHRITRNLPGRANQREGNPEPGRIDHEKEAICFTLPLRGRVDRGKRSGWGEHHVNAGKLVAYQAAFAQSCIRFSQVIVGPTPDG